MVSEVSFKTNKLVHLQIITVYIEIAETKETLHVSNVLKNILSNNKTYENGYDK